MVHLPLWRLPVVMALFVAGGLVAYGAAYVVAPASNWLGVPVDALLFEQPFRGDYPAWLVVALTFGTATTLT